MQAFVGLLILICILVVNAAASSRLVGGPVTPKVGKSRLVMGGVDAPRGKYPYQVSLWLRNVGFWCGGSIINEYYILTAAHCIKGRNPYDLSVKAGSNKLSEPSPYYWPEELIAHEGYTDREVKNDIGLIRLSVKIVYTNEIQPIALPTEDINNAKSPVVLSGWGKISYPGPSSDSLQEITLKLMDMKQCQRRMHKYSVTDKQICTFTKKGEGACQGDSGGPLVADGVEIGIVSFGEPCAIGYPDVYTRVYAYLDWIANNMKLPHDSKNF